MRRVRTRFAGLEVEFADRDVALRQAEEIAERGTRWPLVVYGPEGCGKTALLRQVEEVLRERGYAVIHVNPMAKRLEDRLLATRNVKDIVRGVVSALPGSLADASTLLYAAVEALHRAAKSVTGRIALLADDVFQAVGLDKAETLVKELLNMIEWPSVKYEKIVVIVSSSEGMTRERVGRHRWAELYVMWNMPRDGFAQLYGLLPGPKPSFDSAWRWAGGNPEMLERLYMRSWDVGRIVGSLAGEKGIVELVKGLSDTEDEILAEALEDPDVLVRRYREAEGLVRKLVDRNLIIRIWERDLNWVDQPPPERDPELGVGLYYAWQTPLHREAVRRALGQPP